MCRYNYWVVGEQCTNREGCKGGCETEREREEGIELMGERKRILHDKGKLGMHLHIK